MGFLKNLGFALPTGTGGKGYRAHVQGNQLSDQGKPEEARKKHEEALKYYEQATQEGKMTVSYLMAYGVLLLRMKQFEKAKEIFLKAEHDKRITKEERRQLRLNFAVCQWKLGHLDSAIEQLKIAKADGNNSMIYGSLGYMLIEKAKKTGDFTEAIAFNDEALDYDDEDSVVLDNLGQLNLAMGNREQALEYFKKAHERKPSQVDTLYYLARLAFEDGDKKTAHDYLTQALSGNYSALATVSREQAQELLRQVDAAK